MAENRGFTYKELPQVLVAAREGTLGELTRYVTDRGFSWREQTWALTVTQPTALVEYMLFGLQV
jgi:hypothetical protein